MPTPRPLCVLLATALLFSCSGPTETLFTYSTDGASRTGLLALPGGDVVAGNEAGALLRLTSRGKPVWRVALGREVAARPVAVGDLIVAVTLGGVGVGLAADSGAERWRVAGLTPVSTPLATDGTRVFAVGTDGSIRAIDAASGTTRWHRPAPALKGQYARRFPAPSASGEDLVVALDDAGVWSLATTDGAPHWKLPGLAAADLVVDRGRVLAIERAGLLWALDEATGAVLWKRALPAAITGGLASLGDGVCIGLAPHSLAILDVGSGALSSLVALPGPMTSAPARMGSLWLVPTAATAGVLVGLKPSAGALFEVRLDSPLKTSPVVDGDRALLLASDGRLVGLRVKAPH